MRKPSAVLRQDIRYIKKVKPLLQLLKATQFVPFSDTAPPENWTPLTNTTVSICITGSPMHGTGSQSIVLVPFFQQMPCCCLSHSYEGSRVGIGFCPLYVLLLYFICWWENLNLGTTVTVIWRESCDLQTNGAVQRQSSSSHSRRKQFRTVNTSRPCCSSLLFRRPFDVWSHTICLLHATQASASTVGVIWTANVPLSSCDMPYKWNK